MNFGNFDQVHTVKKPGDTLNQTQNFGDTSVFSKMISRAAEYHFHFAEVAALTRTFQDDDLVRFFGGHFSARNLT